MFRCVFHSSCGETSVIYQSLLIFISLSEHTQLIRHKLRIKWISWEEIPVSCSPVHNAEYHTQSKFIAYPDRRKSFPGLQSTSPLWSQPFMKPTCSAVEVYNTFMRFFLRMVSKWWYCHSGFYIHWNLLSWVELEIQTFSQSSGQILYFQT